MLHSAAATGAYLPPHVQPGFEEAGGRVFSPATPHVQFGYDEAMRSAERDARAGERSARQARVDEAYQYGQQYLNNPLDAKGRSRMERQFWEAPLGGHVRGALEGQEVFGHTIDRDQARMAEQGLAGLTAVGIGVPAFMAAVQQLSTPADQNTIPL
jgi:hypothetical protein